KKKEQDEAKKKEQEDAKKKEQEDAKKKEQEDAKKKEEEDAKKKEETTASKGGSSATENLGNAATVAPAAGMSKGDKAKYVAGGAAVGVGSTMLTNGSGEESGQVMEEATDAGVDNPADGVTETDAVPDGSMIPDSQTTSTVPVQTSPDANTAGMPGVNVQTNELAGSANPVVASNVPVAQPADVTNTVATDQVPMTSNSDNEQHETGSSSYATLPTERSPLTQSSRTRVTWGSSETSPDEEHLRPHGSFPKPARKRKPRRQKPLQPVDSSGRRRRPGVSGRPASPHQLPWRQQAWKWTRFTCAWAVGILSLSVVAAALVTLLHNAGVAT
ncbi:hypothetical protein IWQ62_006145, partial [Dispira parvispora]